MSIDPNEYITATQAADVIGVKRRWVYNLIENRELTCVRLGPKAFLVRRIDAERLKEKRARR